MERIEALEKKSHPPQANLVGGEEFEALKSQVEQLKRQIAAMVGDGK